MQDFTKFLTGRADLLETLQDTKQNRRPEFQKNAPNFQKSAPNFSKTFVVNTQNNNSSYTCPLCNDNHFLHNCQSFRQLTVDERVRKVTELKVCLNCLRPGHINKKCRLSRCWYCNSKHNTLLHTDKETVHIPTIVENNVTLSTDTSTTDAKPSFVFLSTAMVMVGDRHGRLHKARLLLDNGSTANFVTDRLCTKLGLMRSDTSSTVTGIDNQATVSTQLCNLTIVSNNGGYRVSINCHILPDITKSIPTSHVNIQHIPIPTGINLADPSFNVPSSIDILVGAEIFWSVLGSSSIKLGKKLAKPVLQESQLGWLVTGSIPQSQLQSSVCYFVQNNEPDLSRF